MRTNDEQDQSRAILCLTAIFTAALTGCAGSIYAELQDAKHAGKPIFIGHLSATKPDKRGRTDVSMQFFNTSPKTYKYVDVTIEGYNRVGDPVDNIGQSASKLRFTGPLAPRRTPGTTFFPNVWRAGSIACLLVKRIEITHMDGTTAMIEGMALNEVIAAKISTKCPMA